MKIDVAGRVRNVTLPTSRPLTPLFEAVVNSIQAIEDSKQDDGEVRIRIIRDQSPVLMDLDKGSREIISFEITDNGIGFNTENFSAFEMSDTTYKADRGGKGIGRFAWLVAFDSVSIASTFREGHVCKTRSFNFIPKGDGIDSHLISDSSLQQPETTVRLSGYKEKFRLNAPRKAETIAAHVVEHCLEYLIRPNPPKLILIDDATAERIDLNEVFEKEMAANAKSIAFRVGDADFRVLHVKLFSTHIKDHLLHYCADSRVVKSEKLIGRIPNIGKRLTDADGREFVYAAYLDSPLLDSSVNQERTDFSISSDEPNLFQIGPRWSEIRGSTLTQIKDYLAPFTKPIGQQKRDRVEKFAATQGPMYRPILKYIDDDLDAMDPDIADDELDLALYKAYHDLQVRIARQGTELIKSEDLPSSDCVEFEAQLEDYFVKVSDVNKADLARYVFHRRVVLEFLYKILSCQSDGKYQTEKRIHELIFPMGGTSDDVPFEEHNLWILDERLAYHKFLASDKQLRVTTPLNNSSQKELDIIVFDKACAFANTLDGPFQTVTIIEFKRPMRKNYTDDENPFDQVLEYIQEIRKGKARTADGRDVPVSEGVHFYCYIVADITDALEQLAYKAELEKAPDGQGFFGYKKHYKAYFELVSYTKLLTDAKQRNRVFFDKLGLPAVMRALDNGPLIVANELSSTPR